MLVYLLDYEIYAGLCIWGIIKWILYNKVGRLFFGMISKIMTLDYAVAYTCFL